MSEEYNFDQGTFTIPLEGRVLVTDGTSVWQEESAEHYVTNSTDTTLQDNINESYMTADDDGNNSTQYFSVLESTSETILNDISHISLDVTRVGHEFTLPSEENTVESQPESNNQDVVLFRVDGSDVLYGVQIAQDEEGTFQKYQFQVRQNSNGEFETIPETIQIVPFSSEDQLPVKFTQDVLEEHQEEQPIEDPHNEQIFVKQELINEDSMHSVPTQEEEQIFTDDQNHQEEESIIQIQPEESKEGVASTSQLYTNSQIKGEIDVENTVVLKKETDELAAYQQMYFHNDTNLFDPEQENPEDTITTGVIEEGTNGEDSQHIVTDSNLEMYFSEAPEEDESLGSHDTDFLNEDSVDHESDQGIDEIHITTEDNLQHIILDSQRIYKSKLLEVESHMEPIKDTTLKNINRIVKNNNKSTTTILIKNIEKENLATKSFPEIKKSNPRSLLKASVVEHTFNFKPEFEKRFAKGKVAIQARQLQNYISQTKILEVPVRTERLPRKQKIKPLIRSGEEIVVQEVVVSSKGYIETREDGVLRERKPLVPTECIQITDSDDDSGKKKRRKSKRSAQVEIIISDSEDEAPSVDVRPEEIRKLQHQCKKCPKSFPSIGSLNSHMQYHNYSEISDKPEAESSESASSSQNISKYTCSVCKQSFKNIVLLNKHETTHIDQNSKFECKLCNKKFSEQYKLIIHKRSHVKDQMYKKTTLAQVSPKKTKPPASTTAVKSNINSSKQNLSEPLKYKCVECNEQFKNNILLNRHITTHKNKTGKFECNVCEKMFDDQKQWITHKNSHDGEDNGQLKCKECGKVFTSALLLSTHVKLHKQYVCKNCSATFLSKFILDNHVLKNCVKSPVRKKPSPRKSVLCSPRGIRRMSTFDKPTMKPPNTYLKIKCDLCSSTFSSHKNVLKHKVQVHQLNTPDKSIGKEAMRKSLYRQRPDHCGIPAAKKMKNVFAGLKNKLAE